MSTLTLMVVQFNADLARMLRDELLNCINAKAASLSPPMAKVVNELLNVTEVGPRTNEHHIITQKELTETFSQNVQNSFSCVTGSTISTIN